MRPNPDGSPAYIEFRLGDYQHELGIIDSRYAPANSGAMPAGAIMYWHVDDIKATYEQLLTLGATEHQPLINRGDDFVTASVIDPFGNILGIMYNPHYLAILGAHQVIDNPVLEIVHFRVKPGVSDADLLAASAETQKWLSRTTGYLSRELSKYEEGQWIDIVHWRTLAEAQQAAQQIMQEPCAAQFMAMLDPEQISMHHVEQKQYFGRTNNQ